MHLIVINGMFYLKKYDDDDDHDKAPLPNSHYPWFNNVQNLAGLDIAKLCI